MNAKIAEAWDAAALRLDLDSEAPRLSPVQGNVLFASAQHGWIFSLESFASVYAEKSKVDPAQLAKRLWGDRYFDASTGQFAKRPPAEGRNVRSFVAFVLEPLYKIYSHVLGEEPATLKEALLEVGVKMSKEDLALDAIAEVGQGGHFFGIQHTQDRYENAFYMPFLSDWSNFENWRDRGSEETVKRGTQIWKKILDEYEPPAMDPSISEELNAFVERRIAEGGAPTDF